MPPRVPWGRVPSSEISRSSDSPDIAYYDNEIFKSEGASKDFYRIFGKYSPDVLAWVIPYGRQMLGGNPVIAGVGYIDEGYGNIRLETDSARIGIDKNIQDYKSPDDVPVRFRKNGTRK